MSIEMVCGKKKILVDKKLWPFLCLFKWRIRRSHNNFYAFTWFNGSSVSMQRFILNPMARMTVDHINHNGLDNRLKNIRVCTKTQNGYNRPRHKFSNKYLGVARVQTKKGIRYRASTSAGGSYQLHGYFKTEIKAARARDKGAIKIWGEFAKLNFPKEF